MYKKLIPFSLFLFLIPFCFAIYGGENLITHYDKCLNLTISVTGTEIINPTEYSFIGCNETSANNWKCECTDNYNLIMTTKPNTLNDYNFNISHTWVEILPSGGGGTHGRTNGGGVVRYINYTNGTKGVVKNEALNYVLPYKSIGCKSMCGNNVCDVKCKETNLTCPADCKIISDPVIPIETPGTEINVTTPQVNTTPPPVDNTKVMPPNEKSPTMMLLFIGLFIGLIVMIIIGFVISHFVKKKKENFENLKDEIKYEDLQNLLNKDEKR